MEALAKHRKRSCSDMEGAKDISTHEGDMKRTRPSSSSHHLSHSSTASTFAASRWRDSSPENEQPGSVSTISSDEESESESSLSSSSDDVSDDEEDEETVVTIGGPKKPDMNKTEIAGSDADDLQSRLSAFLPELAAANASLGDAAFNVEDVDEDEQYIEMDLGLGVLEEKREGACSSSDGDAESLSGDDDDEGGDAVSRGAVAAEQRKTSENAMMKLKGQERARRKPGIEEV